MKPSIPKGTRDFSPSEMVKRNYIFDTVRNIYQRFGFRQIETPAMELASTLTGKYGDEGDKLIFRILESGDFLEGHLKDIGSHFRFDHEDDLGIEFKDDFSKELSEFVATKLRNNSSINNDPSQVKEKIRKYLLEFYKSKISEKALRYDLTVPFARYVVMHQNDISFPFKRYQIQPVWRADRPQKGRYREFYQCDADIIGSNSLLNEIELIQIIDNVFDKLNIKVVIKVNNRKILNGIAEEIGAVDKTLEIASCLDNLDKYEFNKVKNELLNCGVNEAQVEHLFTLFDIVKFQSQNLAASVLNKKPFTKSQIGNLGTEELISLLQNFINPFEDYDFAKNNTPELKLINDIEWDIKLARGLNYYTGTIIEVKVKDSRSKFTSSICGGGRYDDLTGIFGLPNVSGVGISFGADRIYDVLEEMNGFPDLTGASTKILFVNFGKAEAVFCLQLLKQLRDAGIPSELYPDEAKMKKQLGYADSNKIPYVALIGSDEMKSKMITVKNMGTGEQNKYTLNELIPLLQN